MKRMKQYILASGLLVLSLVVPTSCIEETVPYSSTLIESQVDGISTAVAGNMWGIPKYFNAYSSSAHYMFGYGAMMHIRDVMIDDQAIQSSNYDWFAPWAQTFDLSQDGGLASYSWSYYYGFIHTINQALLSMNGVGEDNALYETYQGYRAVARTFRALMYLEMAQLYEFKENEATTSINEDGHDISGLTVPIVREGITEAEARNNPRAKKEDIAAFILEDLTFAKENIGFSTLHDKTMPDEAAVNGLLARYYLWLEDYPKARAAAREAINVADVKPMTEEEGLSKTNGFNDISKWIWGVRQTEEDNTVRTGIINWTSWMSNETSFGYAGGGGVYVMIDKNLYESIGNKDWRKKMWKAPEGEALEGKTPWIDPSAAESYPDYSSAKFRPNNGEMDNYSVGGASSYPIMRVEEMYFIEAEAAAHSDVVEGLGLLETFMNMYRDPTYSIAHPENASQEDAIDEIILQKRIELWGEGLTFFDIKRLNMGIKRGYSGTNFAPGARFNTNSRPAWMNFCINRYEAEDNPALDGWNNPNPTRKYPVWTGADE